MSNKNTNLLHYLKSHGLIDDTLVHGGDKVDLSAALVKSGVFTQQQIEQLHGMLHGLPHYDLKEKVVPVETQSLVPYLISEEHRVVCVENKDNSVCLVTDNSEVDQSVLDMFEHKKVTSFFASTQDIENLLTTYRQTTYQNMIDSITSVEKRVRKEEDFGTEIMSQFFPTDHMKEIAEDLSVKKLWQRIVSLAQIMKAESLSVQTRSDKIVVRMRIANKMQDTVTLKRSTANSLYVAARYYCDLPFKQNTEIEKGYTNIFSHNKTEVFPVWFTSTQTGFSIDIFPNSVDEMQSKVQELGLSVAGQDELISFLRSPKGMCVISGKEQSGKTFAYYQLIEACASRFNVASIERVTEYIVDKVNQISWLQRPEKDLQSIVVNHDVLAISDPRNSIDSLLLRIAREKTVILETGIGIMPFIKKLLQKGKTLKDISSACSYNLVSFVFESLEPTDRVQYKLSASDLSTLEEYISIEELKYLLELSGESHKNITRFNDVSWVQKVDTQTSLLQHFGLFKRKTLAVSASKKYLRALVDINYELEQAVKHNKTLIELEQSIKHAQKQSLLHTALIPAFRKEIDITELIAMLRA